jgi:hypothetical protein
MKNAIFWDVTTFKFANVSEKYSASIFYSSCCLPVLFFYPEDGSSTLVRNFGKPLHGITSQKSIFVSICTDDSL